MTPTSPQWMPPIDPIRFDRRWAQIVAQMTMLLPQFVGEKKRDDNERDDKKSAQYEMLDHGDLRSQELIFIVEHRVFPGRAAPLSNPP